MLSTPNSGMTFSVRMAICRWPAASRGDRPRRCRGCRRRRSGRRARDAPSALGVVRHDLAVAAVGAAGEQQDVGRQRLDGAHVGGGQPVGERADELGAGAQRGLPRGFRGQLLDEADGDHPQAAGRRRGGEAILEGGQAPELALEVRERRSSPIVTSVVTVDGPCADGRARGARRGRRRAAWCRWSRNR